MIARKEWIPAIQQCYKIKTFAVIFNDKIHQIIISEASGTSVHGFVLQDINASMNTLQIIIYKTFLAIQDTTILIAI